jgi:hypothetical protein
MPTAKSGNLKRAKYFLEKQLLDYIILIISTYRLQIFHLPDVFLTLPQNPSWRLCDSVKVNLKQYQALIFMSMIL